jgi:dipeptidase E
MSRLLLLSNSTQHGQGYLDHAESELRDFLRGCDELFFVPWALADLDGYANKAKARFAEFSIRCRSLHAERDPRAALREATAIFVGGGNTFRLLHAVQSRGLIEILRERVGARGLRYIGASAGTNLACPTIRTTNDMPIVQPASFEALGLVSFQINPHYLDPDPNSSFGGETRETRIREYLEENALPVLGLREGSWLNCHDGGIRLGGPRAARLFRRGQAPQEIAAGSELGPSLAAV